MTGRSGRIIDIKNWFGLTAIKDVAHNINSVEAGSRLSDHAGLQQHHGHQELHSNMFINLCLTQRSVGLSKRGVR